MTLFEAIEVARTRACQLRVDSQFTIAEVYQAELLRRLQPLLRGGVGWKGGVVLRMEGSERFSRDLDATRHGNSISPRRLESVLRKAATGLPFLAGVVVSRRPQRVHADFRFALPGLPHSLRLRVEVSTREKLLRPPESVGTARLAQAYGVEPVLVARLDEQELLAEKVRALIMRDAARDVYDVYWLLQRGVEFDLSLFRRKMEYYGQPGKPTDLAAIVRAKAGRLEASNPERLRTELSNLLPAARRNLDFGVICEDVARALRAWQAELVAQGARKPAARRRALRRPRRAPRRSGK